MKKCLLNLVLLLWVSVCFAQQGDDTIMNRIVLIGDAGELVDGKAPVMQAVKKLIPLDKRTAVVFLGDNLYRHGLPHEQEKIYSSLRAVLDSQIAVVTNTKAVAYMMPGNHDWENGGPNGYAAILRQQQYVDAIGKNIKYYPEDGCPGPVEVSIGTDVVLIIMDSQWWLHEGVKPGIESDCPSKTKSEVLSEIEDIIINNPKKLVLFACHHPFKSNGYHGGYFGIKQHIFPFLDLNKKLYIPLPIIGSIYPISRGVFGSPQDLKHPAYANMIDTIQAVVKQHPNVIFVAGHEHTLQYFEDSSFHYIVSGSGCKAGAVSDNKKSEFVSSTRGFAVLEVSKNKNVKVKFYGVKPDSTSVLFTKDLLNFSSPSTIEDTIASVEPVYVYKDSALVAVGAHYNEASKLKRFVMGDNYRAEWATPIKLKVFNINKEKGGLKIVAMGGGRQTRTLTLVDKKGVEWKLRTIDKDPESILPADRRSSLSPTVLQDMISASYPYGPLIVPALSEAVDVPHTQPQFFYVPDDPSLGFYRKLFANKVCLLEIKTPVSPRVKTRSTAKLLNKMIEENDHVVDQNSVLKARLLDILIADWDRHFDQWRWEVGDTGKGKVYSLIPRDRDEAFFYSDGALLKYLARGRFPYLKGFKHNIPRINWLGYTARDFDRLFLNDLEKKEWEKTISEFQGRLSDTTIEQAVKKLPGEIYAISGAEITEKLKSRRDLLMKEGIEYYDFISRYVNVMGSNEEEYFKISPGAEEQHVLVQVYAKEEDTSFLKYSRDFSPEHTKEIRLYGLSSNDKFFVDEKVKSRIRLRIIGGQGNDTFDINGEMRNFVYDLTTEENSIQNGSHTKERMSSSPFVNQFDYNEFKYQDKEQFPAFNFGFNSEDGPMAGLGFLVRTYGFRKAPFATENRFSALYSFLGNAYRFRYSGIFTDAIYKNDIVINAQFVNPTLNNFFGLGNETQKAPDIDRSFYRVRYKFVSGDLLLRKRFFGRLSIAVGPTFSYYWIKYTDNDDRILARPELVDLSFRDVYSKKTYLGGKIQINVNNTNNDIFPTRGVNWDHEFVYLNGLNENTTPLTRYQTDMAVYASLTDPARLVAVLRFGGGKIFSDDFEYFQALNLGGNNYLRGYRKNRFSGHSSLYNSVELWYKLADLKSYVVPGAFGIVGFNDLGRVWMKGQESKKWHHGYGGGLYYIPFNLIIVSATAGISEEETIFNFTIGTKLNLTF